MRILHLYISFQIGVLNSTQAAVEFMGKPNGGKGGIVMNVGSVCGLDIIGGLQSYTASKFGVVGLTRSYAVSSNECRFQKTKKNVRNTLYI